MTLTRLAETTKDFEFSKVNKSVEERQKNVINYFESHVEMEGIEFMENGE